MRELMLYVRWQLDKGHTFEGKSMFVSYLSYNGSRTVRCLDIGFIFARRDAITRTTTIQGEKKRLEYETFVNKRLQDNTDILVSRTMSILILSKRVLTQTPIIRKKYPAKHAKQLMYNDLRSIQLQCGLSAAELYNPGVVFVSPNRLRLQELVHGLPTVEYIKTYQQVRKAAQMLTVYMGSDVVAAHNDPGSTLSNLLQEIQSLLTVFLTQLV